MESTFNGGVLITVRSVDGVLTDAGSIQFADSALGSFGRVGGTDQGTKIFNGIVLLQYGGHNGAPGHKLDQFTKERTLPVDAVEFLCIPLAQLGVLHGHDIESGSRDFFQNRTDVSVFNSIWLDHGKRSISRHFL